MSRYENGHHAIRPVELRHTLDVYRVTDPAVRDALLSLARQGRQKGWWRGYRDRLSPSALDFVSLETGAGQIRTFQLSVVPGLLQTPDYATAVIKAGISPTDHHDIDQVVGFRIARQRILMRQNPPLFRVVLGEAALRQRIGSPDIMKGQLLSLIDKSAQGQADVRVLPFAHGGHPGIDGSFTILDIGDHGMLSVVFVEALSRSWYIEEQEELARYHEVFHRLGTPPSRLAAVHRAPSLGTMMRQDLPAMAWSAMAWRKSSRSGSAGTDCVEVAGVAGHLVAVRDSKDPDGPVLRFEAAEWASFVARVRAGRARP